MILLVPLSLNWLSALVLYCIKLLPSIFAKILYADAYANALNVRMLVYATRVRRMQKPLVGS